MDATSRVKHATERLIGCALVFFLGYFGVATTSGAVCIASGDTTALKHALDAATVAGAPPIAVKLEQGTYAGDYLSYEFKTNVTIWGGYLPNPQHTCDENQRQIGADNTQLQLNFGTGIYIAEGYETVLSIENVTFNGGFNVSLYATNLELADVHFTNLSSFQGGVAAVLLGVNRGEGTIAITNTQFDHLHASGPTDCSIYVELNGYTNATINHATVDLSGGTDLCFSDGLAVGTKDVKIWNSIVWDSSNSGGKISAYHTDAMSPITIELDNVDYTALDALPTDIVYFDPRYPVIHQDPLWANPAGGDYSLSQGQNSPVINKATTAAIGGEPATDIAGSIRQIGSAPDLGAYESQYNDYAGANVLTVTNTNDVSDENSPGYSGSLRWAMSKAIALSGKSLVTFSLPSCPATIVLNNPLPLVWYPLTLDGYTAPGSVANSAVGDLFNANLCVAIQPASTLTTPSALIVPSGGHDASLTVKGIGFGGFSQAIQLWGGYSHEIVGNQFGGTMNGVLLFGFDTAAVHIDMSGAVTIGGPNPADRNVFLKADSGPSAAGVLVGAFTNNAQPECQILGNLFGITPDGFSANPNNEYGILLQGNGCSVRKNRMAGNVHDAIEVLGGSKHVIQNNVIGPAIFFGQDFFNPGAGIRITAGGSSNIIGAGSGFYGRPDYFGNTIEDMDAGGVIVAGNGTGNSVRGNIITANGLSTGLNLDLGSDGPTSNDLGDSDSGANDLMNFPIEHALAWTNGVPTDGMTNNPAELRATLNAQPGDYQIDVYYDHLCSPTGRGGGRWIAVQELVTIPAGSHSAGFSMPIVIPDFDPIHGELSVTATTRTNFSTSEFGTCMSVDTIFSDAFEE